MTIRGGTLVLLVLATRARRHVQPRRPRFQIKREQREELARRFFAAAEHGDLAWLEMLLAHDVELTVMAAARFRRGRGCYAVATCRARMMNNLIHLVRAFLVHRYAPSRSTADRERSCSSNNSG